MSTNSESLSIQGWTCADQKAVRKTTLLYAEIKVLNGCIEIFVEDDSQPGLTVGDKVKIPVPTEVLAWVLSTEEVPDTTTLGRGWTESQGQRTLVENKRRVLLKRDQDSISVYIRDVSDSTATMGQYAGATIPAVLISSLLETPWEVE